MIFKGYRVSTVVIALIVILGLFFLAEGYFFRFQIEKPLKEALLDHPQVLNAEVNSTANGLAVDVDLEWAEDLRSLHLELEDLILEVSGEKEYRLNIGDRRTSELEEIFHALHFDLYEALATGQFGLLQENDLPIEAELSERRITIDSLRIYIQLRTGDEYLYQIIERE